MKLGNVTRERTFRHRNEEETVIHQRAKQGLKLSVLAGETVGVRVT